VDRHVHKAGEPVDEARETAAAAVDADAREPYRDGNSGCGEPAHSCGRQRWRILLHINREMPHHGAEIALLRDLYLWHFADGTR
jgi:hypothetical protein